MLCHLPTKLYTTVHTVIHFHLIRLHSFLGGILSLWRQKSNRSNNIRCALTGVHWESGLVTAHASIALRGGAQMFALETQSCESATTARGKVHHRQGHSLHGHTSTILADAGQWTSPYLKTICIKSNYTFNILSDERVAKLQF